MLKVTNEIRSKIMKAAGKIFKSRYKIHNSKNWRKALVLAWKWAKEKLLVDYKIWSPRPDMARVYFGDNDFIQFNLGKARGYYARHRAAKGDDSARTAFYKVSGLRASELSVYEIEQFAFIAVGTRNLVESQY